MRITKAILSWILLLGLSAYVPAQNIDRSHSIVDLRRLSSAKSLLILVHYIPWFQTPSTSGYWGWHWTMNHFNPNVIDTNGQREIASHYYPLTGPYDSSDKDMIEYQVLLMKISGIDGVIVDWYGKDNFLDYGVINSATNLLFNYIVRSGMLFSICYEDQSIKNLITDGYISANNSFNVAEQVMIYVQNNWFSSDNYVILNNDPVLLNFGPQYFTNSANWDTLFSVLNTPPLFFTLDSSLTPVTSGAFPWPPMWAATNGVLTQQQLSGYLTAFYQKASSWPYKIGGAFPGFHDIYSEAGLGFTYGYLDAQNGATFAYTFQTALNNNPDIIQVVTWNDYGEGTMVEPTKEFGYQYLQQIQNFRKLSIDTSFSFSASDLTIPLQIFNLRKSNKNNSKVNSMLDNAFNLIIEGKPDSAQIIVNNIDAATKTDDSENPIYGNYQLMQNYPNPFNSVTIIKYDLPQSGLVTIKLYDVLGREIKTMVDEYKNKGIYSLELDDSGLSSGVYFYSMSSGNFSQCKKMVILK